MTPFLDWVRVNLGQFLIKKATKTYASEGHKNCGIPVQYCTVFIGKENLDILIVKTI